MVENHPDFDFKFEVLRKFEYETAVDMHDKTTEWVHSAALGIYMRNWAEFIVYKASAMGEDVSSLKLSDFAGKVHGYADEHWEDLEPMGVQQGLTASQVHFDKLGTLTAIQFDTNNPIQPTVMLGETQKDHIVEQKLT